MTPRRRLLLVQEVNGVAGPTGAGLAVLLDISLDEIDSRLDDPHGGLGALPSEWQQLAQRRVREGQAASGATGAAPLIMHLARRRWGDQIDLDLDADAGSLWLVTDDPDIATWLAGTANNG